MKCEILPETLSENSISSVQEELLTKEFVFDHCDKFLIPKSVLKNKKRITVDGRRHSLPGILAIQKAFIEIVKADALVRLDTDDVGPRAYVRSCREVPKTQDRDIHKDGVHRYIAVIDQDTDSDSGPIVFEGYDHEIEIYGKDTSWIVERNSDGECVLQEQFQHLSITKLAGASILFIPKGALHGSDSSVEGHNRLVLQGDVYLD